MVKYTQTICRQKPYSGILVFRENPYSGIFYAMGDVLIDTCNDLEIECSCKLTLAQV